MVMMTVTRNGQVTIPKEMREKLGIEEGTRVVMEERDGRILLRKGEYDWSKHKQILADGFEETIKDIRKGSFRHAR